MPYCILIRVHTRRRPGVIISIIADGGIAAAWKPYLIIINQFVSIIMRLLLIVAVVILFVGGPTASASIGGRRLSPPRLCIHRSNRKQQGKISTSQSKTSETTSLLNIPIIPANQGKKATNIHHDSLFRLRAGGHQPAAIPVSNGWDQTVGVMTQILWQGIKIMLPIVAYTTKLVVGFYRSLPKDALIAQAGLVFCFAGGYYPALFASVQAAQNCGWNTMCEAVDALVEEAGAAIDAVALEYKIKPPISARKMFQQTTMTVLKSVDPVKINQATGALYTTWLGVSTVLEREFAKTIALSVSIAGYLTPMANFMFDPALQLCIPDDYQQWIPVLIGWGCKAAAMTIAWRIQRVFTIYTSAITGGLMFSRACMRMLAKRGVTAFGMISDNDEQVFIDEVFGLALAGLGMYSQIETGIETGFSMRVPFPMSLVTWPFELAEKWIEWQITPDPVSL